MDLVTVVDLVIAFTLVEVAALVVWRWAGGEAPSLRDWGPNLAAGLALMGALRLAVADAGLHWIVLALMTAGVAHALDMAIRWPRRRAARHRRAASAG